MPVIFAFLDLLAGTHLSTTRPILTERSRAVIHLPDLIFEGWKGFLPYWVIYPTLILRLFIQGVTNMGYTVLVVEDTLDTRELMRYILEAEGYRVLEAENGVVAVDTAQREQPDAILMDMSLPLMDGCQATRLIRKLPGLRATPIIACTAHNQWDWRSKAILAGCNEFLTKPLQTKLLLGMLSRYLPERP